MTDVTENTTEEVVSTEATAPAQSVELTVNDLHSLKTIIDVASARGAFKPAEMTAVGQTYTKLTSFLDEITKQSEGSK